MSSLQAAIEEAYATARSDVAEIESIEISHPSLVGGVFLVKSMTDLSLKLEDGYKNTTPGPVQLFTACGFRLRRPALNADGLQEIQISIDNVDRRISDFLAQTTNFTTKVSCLYRIHLSNNLMSPQLIPPLELALTDVEVGLMEVSARASFADLVNQPFPSWYYYRSRFPGLFS